MPRELALYCICPSWHAELWHALQSHSSPSLTAQASTEQALHVLHFLQVTAMALGRSAKQRDKIFIAAGNTVSTVLMQRLAMLG